MEEAVSAAGHARALPTIGPQAPRVRIIAGAGTSGQKTWNMRRAAMLVGRQRSAHLRFDHTDVSKAHALIVNTGSNVLVRDLCSRAGVKLNEQGVDLAVLSDGDVLQIGPVTVQIAIRSSSASSQDTGTDMTYQDPTRLPGPLQLEGSNGEGPVVLSRAVSVFGRREGCDVLVDDESASQLHAVVFLAEQGPVVLDLGSPNGTWVNDQRVEWVYLSDGDTLRVGSSAWTVRLTDAGQSPKDDPAHAEWSESEAAGAGDKAAQVEAASSSPHPAQPESRVGTPSLSSMAESVLGDIEQRIASLHQNTTETWEQLNAWHGELEGRESRLADREKDLDAGDKALAQGQKEFDERSRQLDQRDAQCQQALEELEGQRAEIRQLQESYEQQRAELEALSEKAQAAQEAAKQEHARCQQQKEQIDKSAAELESRRRNLDDETRKIKERDAQLVQAEQDVQSARTELETNRAQLEARQKELDTAQAEVKSSQETQEQQQAELSRHNEQLDARAQQLERQEAAVKQRRTEVEEAIRQVSDRMSAIESFGESLSRVNEAFCPPGQRSSGSPPAPPEQAEDQQASPPANVAEPSSPEQAPSKAKAEEPADAATPPASDEDSVSSEPAEPEAPGPANPPAAAKDQSAAQRPSADLDPETGDRLRMLRRLGAKGTDEELTQQIQAEREEAERKKKRSWWRRGSGTDRPGKP